MKRYLFQNELNQLEGYVANEILIDGEILIHAVNDENKTAYTKQPNAIQYYLNEYDYVKQVIALHSRGLY